MKNTSFLLAVCLLLLLATPMSAQWVKTNGPEGGRIWSQVALGGKIFLGTGGGVFASSDNGDTWEIKTTSLNAQDIRSMTTYQNDLIIAARNKYAATNLYRSSDYGETWTKISDFDFSVVQGLIVHENTILVSNYGFLGNSTHSWYYRSEDGGQTWEELTDGFPNGEAEQCRDFAWQDGAFYAGNSYGVFKSTDDGKTWVGLNHDPNSESSSLAVSGDTLLVGDLAYDIVLSYDGGATWTTKTLTGLGVDDVAIHNGTMFAATAYGVYRSFDGGDTWSLTAADDSEGHLSIDNGWVYASKRGEGGVWRSNDLGNNWLATSTTGLRASLVYSLVPLDNKICALTDEPNGITITNNFGNNWQLHVPTNNDGLSYTMAAHNGKIFVNGFFNLNIYDPANDLWSFVPPNGSLPWVFDFESAGGYLFAASSGAYRSGDEGLTWENSPIDAGDYFTRSGNTLYVAGYPGKIYRTDDFGNNWALVKDFSQDFPGQSILAQAVGNVLFAYLLESGLYRSLDGGATWEQQAIGNSGNISTMTAIGNTIIIGMEGLGVFASSDNGDTWVDMNEGLFHPNPSMFAIGNDGFLYMAASYGSVWRRSLDDFNFDRLVGKVYQDLNNNGQADTDEPGLQAALVYTVQGNSFASSDQAGDYTLYVSGLTTDTLRAVAPNPYAIVNPGYYLITPLDSIKDFGITYLPGIEDVRVTITEITPSVLGQDVAMVITYKNEGTTPLDGSVFLQPDPNLQYVSSNPMEDGSNNGELKWDYFNLQPHESNNIYVVFHLPADVALLGTQLVTNASVTPVDTDAQPSNNYDALRMVVVGSYDPNDKQVTPAGSVTPEQLQAGQTMTYTVRFQNTGTYQAFDIRIVDTLSANLDISTFQVLSASHPYTFSIRGNGVVEFRFDDINLPDSTTNEPESHGFIKYSVQCKKDLNVGDAIANTAYIYFDQNPAVVTNTVVTEIDFFQSTTASPNNDQASFVITPTLVSNKVVAELRSPNLQFRRMQILGSNGKCVADSKVNGRRVEIDTTTLPGGFYILRMETEQGTSVGRFVKP